MFTRIKALRLCLLVVFAPLFSTQASADVIFDQDQPAWTPALPPYEIGGFLSQQVAQTYQAGVSGRLHQLRFRLACDTSSVGNLYVEIQGVTPTGEPSGLVYGSASISSLDLLPATGEDYILQDFSPAGVGQVNGTSYAIVIRGDEGTSCFTPQGPGEGSVFAYSRGAAYVGETTAGSAAWMQTDPRSDYAFGTYVETLEPGFCEVTDAAGTPNDWLSADVPACGCLVDPVLNAHRCWFGLPDFVLWREIAPYEASEATAMWEVLPLNSGMETIFVQEFSDSAQGPEVVFDKNLAPGKSQKEKFNVAPYGEFSEVSIMFLGPRGDGLVVFKVYQSVPE